ncbi:hypothetical protein XENOCAPTIV_014210 [Xenoophorus captivus]|uniref:Ig-like domain-containing protein n=1 Tax=Xenoophorus captivus TaxID=1517983 RepID=A0ABV0Q9X3_9TELE
MEYDNSRFLYDGFLLCERSFAVNIVPKQEVKVGGLLSGLGNVFLLSAVGQRQATLTVLLPSSEELQQGKATLMCLANKSFPSDWSLSWKVDGSSSSFTWEENRSRGVLQKDDLYSCRTLRLPADQWKKGSHTPVKETLRRDQCSQS